MEVCEVIINAREGAEPDYILGEEDGAILRRKCSLDEKDATGTVYRLSIGANVNSLPKAYVKALLGATLGKLAEGYLNENNGDGLSAFLQDAVGLNVIKADGSVSDRTLANFRHDIKSMITGVSGHYSHLASIQARISSGASCPGDKDVAEKAKRSIFKVTGREAAYAL